MSSGSSDYPATTNPVREQASDGIEYYSTRRLRDQALLITALLLVNKLGNVGNIACYVFLFAWALRSPQDAIKAVSVSGLIIMASDFFVTHGELIAPLKFLLLGVAGFTILQSVKDPLTRGFLVCLLLFGAVCALLSLYNGYFVPVSLLKIASFTYGAFCLLAIVQVRGNLAPELLEWAFALTLVVVALSCAALAIGVGDGAYDTVWGFRFSGYRGVFSHPQTLGAMACILAVFLTSLLLFVDFPRRHLAVIMLLGLFVLLYLSEARIGLLGFGLAMGVTLALVGFSQKPVDEAELLHRYQATFVAAVVFAVLTLMLLESFTGSVSQGTTQFLAKGKSVDRITADFLLSAREEQIYRNWRVFKTSPWTGIGFGTDTTPWWQRSASLFSASTEKGFLPTAILAEIGLIGTAFFLGFLVSLYSFVIRERRYLGLALFTGYLVVNLGEMMFFAFGGMAMLCWPLVAMSMTVSNAQLQGIKRPQRKRSGQL